MYVSPETDWTQTAIRARATQVADRYNWRGQTNSADVRYRFQCTVRYVRGRIGVDTLGALISG